MGAMRTRRGLRQDKVLLRLTRNGLRVHADFQNTVVQGCSACAWPRASRLVLFARTAADVGSPHPDAKCSVLAPHAARSSMGDVSSGGESVARPALKAGYR